MWRIEYFEAMSQIGPVLLLAFVVEARVNRGSRPRAATKEWMRRLGVGLVLFAEAITLMVVAGVLEPTGDRGMQIAAGMLLGCSYLPVAIAQTEDPEGTDHAVQEWAAVGFFFWLPAIVLSVWAEFF